MFVPESKPPFVGKPTIGAALAVAAVVGEDHISITPLTWDRTYGIQVDGQKELAQLKKVVEHDAPQP
ncbi:hypothetical protein EV643_103476 [Kribbella sp. VKM Ac-2527]|uniref:Uncharacterized protein n=1 Tax=Kribbella caucasensis TaxID=2512215 RepID=A0A4R6KK85_9ACTN|nr:hypothetical protein [Kribbella sp. VKM Ac-2527]TDO51737.1 hypothetical protein EV643_103476 [Kribbella sp. VKM Ac-2527]